MTDFNNDDFDFQSAAIKTRNIDALLKDYEEKGGSTVFSLKTLRSHVAKIIPFSDPKFIFHWSDIARRAILSDIAANCPSSSVGGTPPASLAVNEDSPIFIFPHPKGKALNQLANPLYLIHPYLFYLHHQSPLPLHPLPL